ncbi:MAG TPA: hypothetical protein VJL27_02650 [Patescibacteria group bacterium]|nr:hypothetical protein [Patescibacteria group bacterium]
MPKVTVNNVASVAIIYPEIDPTRVFLCQYDDGYPAVVFRGMYNPIGGNWIGPLAVSDQGPRCTIKRELQEELVLGGPPADRQELVSLGLVDQIDADEKVSGETTVGADPNDAWTLIQIRSSIQEALRPWGSYYHLAPKAVFDASDTLNKRGDTSTLVCCWLAPLGPEVWSHLARLQTKYGNLTNEGYTRVTSLDEIVDEGRMIAWGHRQAYCDFWMSKNLTHEQDVRCIESIQSRYVGPIPASYDEILTRYHVLRTPFNA